MFIRHVAARVVTKLDDLCFIYVYNVSHALPLGTGYIDLGRVGREVMAKDE
jgi:hypothetical protein